MSVKRSRPSGSTERAHPSKRPRLDQGLATIWSSLAHESEDVRLQAAIQLIQKHCQVNDQATATSIARRLFKGLCSGNKAARLGFYVALVGALAVRPFPFGANDAIDFVTILKQESTPESNTSGQDERDHHFGRLLACKAVIESGMLTSLSIESSTITSSLAEIVFGLMVQKPWLRHEASAIIYSIVDAASKGGQSSTRDIAIGIIQLLKKHKIAKTCDGIYISLHIRTTVPNLKLSQDIWVGADPLHNKNLLLLKQALLEQRSTTKDEDEVNVGKTSGWSSCLHNVWPTILRELRTATSKSRVSFEKFWKDIVDDGLFSPASSTERKCTGVLLLKAALALVEPAAIHTCFSKNVMVTLLQHLKPGSDTYLRQVAVLALSQEEAAQATQRDDRADAIAEGLLRGSNFVDFDVVTKTSTIANLLQHTILCPNKGVGAFMLELLMDNGQNTKVHLSMHQKTSLLNILQRSLDQMIRNGGNDASEGENFRTLLASLLKLQRSTKDNEPDDSIQALVSEKFLNITNELLATGLPGCLMFVELIMSDKTGHLNAEREVADEVERGSKLLERLYSSAKKQNAISSNARSEMLRTPTESQEVALAVLLAMLVYEVTGGDAESAELLQDVNDLIKRFLDPLSETNTADDTVDFVMSLMSKPLKFHRRVAELVFEAFACEMTSVGLQGLVGILVTKESLEGQLELFEDNADIPDEDEETSDQASVGPDVEISDSKSDEASGDDDEVSAVNSEESRSDTNSDTSESDEELKRFESALAAALGTRKLKQGDLISAVADSYSGTDSDADSDLSDSQMMGLDQKLSEVFKNQQTQLSNQRQRKSDVKNAKENVINLKNRALDLTDLFLRTRKLQGMLSVDLLMTLIEAAESTSSQQIISRICSINNNHVHKVRGNRLPQLESTEGARSHLWQQIGKIHDIVSQATTSNIVIDSAGQLHLLLCKLLLQTGQTDVSARMEELKHRDNTSNDKRKSVRQFWARYEAWAGTLI